MTRSKDWNKCVACNKVTTQFTTDDGEYYYPQCGECN